MAKDTFYFSHDYNARQDDKIKRLIRKFGMLGYGIYWAIVEDLYNNANALRTDYEGIAYDLHSDIDTVKSIINDFELFEISDGYFGSLSIERRINERDKKSQKARESAFYRWKYANALRTQCDGNAIKEIKGKEIKGKDNIPHQYFPQIPINPNALTYEQTKSALETEQSWKEQMAMEFHTTVEMIEKELTVWVHKQYLAGKFPCEMHETKRHFYFTLNKSNEEKVRVKRQSGKYQNV